MKTDTIAAISSSMSPSGIGIIRISGEDAFTIIDKIYRSKSGKKVLSEMASHTIHYGFICDGEEIVDEVMVLLMRAPHTYTREDCIEIDCHGGSYVMRRILETVIRYGARPAEPGEFTKRAFFNGRIDLSQAESVIDVIQSENEFSLQSSLQQLRGSVKKEIKEIREIILHEVAFIESALDDPEHISLENYPEKLSEIVDTVLDRIEKILKTADNGKILKEGITTVIMGKPNAGKSSLLNILVGEDRAIVTEVEGTTRDVLTERINLNGIVLNLIDTAGIRDSSDIVEKIGVDKSLSYASKADLIVYVVDSSRELDENDYRIMDFIKGRKSITLLNKSDLKPVIEKEDIQKYVDTPVILTSAKEQEGIELLQQQITDMFFNGDITFNQEVIITNVRHKAALSEAHASLELVKWSIEDGMSEDFYSIDLMNTYTSLGSIIGESVDDDLVNEIFSKFCMGK